MNTKLKKLISGILSTAIAAATFVSALAYNDMDNHWGKPYVDYVSEKGWMNGYDDDSFKPDRYITRAEVAQVLVKLNNKTDVTDKDILDLDDNAWYAQAIRAAVQAGYIQGEENASGEMAVRPEDNITREETFVILQRACYADSLATEKNLPFTDEAEVSEWAVMQTSTLVNEGKLDGYEDGTVRPKRNISRAEFAKLLGVIQDMPEPEVTPTPAPTGNNTDPGSNNNIGGIISVGGGTNTSGGGGGGSSSSEKHTATFYSEGKVYTKITVQNGSYLTPPEDPTREGYVFAGWYTSSSTTGTPYDFSNKIRRNIQLYAKWIEATEEKAVVTFNTNGGSAIEAQEVVKGEKVTKPSDPSKEDVTFTGWFTDSSCKKGTEFDFENTVVNDNITLYAQWTMTNSNIKTITDDFITMYNENADEASKLTDDDKYTFVSDETSAQEAVLLPVYINTYKYIEKALDDKNLTLTDEAKRIYVHALIVTTNIAGQEVVDLANETDLLKEINYNDPNVSNNAYAQLKQFVTQAQNGAYAIVDNIVNSNIFNATEEQIAELKAILKGSTDSLIKKIVLNSFDNENAVKAITETKDIEGNTVDLATLRLAYRMWIIGDVPAELTAEWVHPYAQDATGTQYGDDGLGVGGDWYVVEYSKAKADKQSVLNIDWTKTDNFGDSVTPLD